MATRYFNNITVVKDTLIKSSEENFNKIKDEYLWLKEIEKELSLKKYVPENLSIDEENKSISMKHYEQGDLGKISLKSTSYKEMNSIVNDVLNIFRDFKNIPVENKLSDDDARLMYYQKTKERINEIPFFKDYRYWLINGKIIDSINMTVLLNKCINLYKNVDYGIIHGDLFFSNILKDNNNLKLIDARGRFGKDFSIYGDRRYDLAKLRHSISGGYDYIVNDKFSVKYKGNIIDYKINFKYNNKEVVKYFDKEVSYLGYNKDDIKFIEGLLFLTMIPLHKENLNHQMIFWALALEKLNG